MVDSLGLLLVRCTATTTCTSNASMDWLDRCMHNISLMAVATI
jgi:hypothetical protein